MNKNVVSTSHGRGVCCMSLSLPHDTYTHKCHISRMLYVIFSYVFPPYKDLILTFPACITQIFKTHLKVVLLIKSVPKSSRIHYMINYMVILLRPVHQALASITPHFIFTVGFLHASLTLHRPSKREMSH